MPTGLGTELGWWCPSLQDDSASSTVTDLTGNGHNLTNFNTDATNWVADTDSGGVRAVNLDGAVECHTVSSPLDGLIGTDFTLSIWTKKDDTSGGHMLGLYNTGGTSTQQDHHALWHSTSATYGTSAISYRNYATTRIVHASNTITANPTTWRHLLATFAWTGSIVRITLYIGGVEITASQSSVTVPDSMNLLAIGCNLRDDSTGRTAFLDGRWDDARIFGSIPSTKEIQYLSSNRGIQGGPRTSPYAKNFLFLDFI